VIIYNGEMILLFIKECNLSFTTYTNPDFRGTKKGNLYLTSHRIIFVNREAANFHSLSMPFSSMRTIKLEQPILGANYLAGVIIAQPGGNFDGEANWKLTFNRGGCIDFGQALLKANDMANSYRPQNAPPMYAPPAGSFFAAPPAYYTAPGGQYNGFQAPVQSFPDQPPAGSVFMYEQPPPYPGIGPDQTPHPVNNQGGSAAYPNLNGMASAPPDPYAPPPYPAAMGQAPPLPPKA